MWILFVIIILAAIAYWVYRTYVFKPQPKFYHIGAPRYSFSLQPVSDIAMTTAMAALPGKPGQFLAATKDGKVYYFNHKGAKQLVLDLKQQPVQFTDAHMEQGLMGLAFHPENDRVYLTFSTEPSLKGRKMDHIVAEYRLRKIGDEFRLDPTREIFRHSYREPSHHGGTVAFGPDGALYLSTGDGGPQKDPFNESQNPRTLAGKILRFDVENHAKPPPQIVASGLRNPWRMSFDDHGQLWIGDVGFDTFESLYKFSVPEVVIGRKPPPNFGWSQFEGSKRLRGAKPFSAFEAPIFEYPNSNETGRSILGGEYDHTNDLYVFGDWVGIVRGLQYNKDRKRWEQVAKMKTPENLFAFGKDQNTGQIYALGEKRIYKVAVI